MKQVTNLNLIESEQVINCIADSPSLSLSLDDLLKKKILAAPGTHIKLDLSDGYLFDSENKYFFKESSPVLYPPIISSAWINEQLPLSYEANALRQYALLSQIKQAGEINAPLDSIPARKHQWRYKDFCKDLEGVVLDIGCDKPSHSRQLLPRDISYIGLDPYAGSGEFRLIALGEMLPIASESIDAITFNTSLDHILDYHTAIEEAFRVLKPNGVIVIATYAWLENATLLTDSVHFHHFREYQILGALNERFQLNDLKRYVDPKNATHRYGLYVMAKKKVS